MMRHLTVRSVKSMLSRAGINCNDLNFEPIDRSATHTRGIYQGRHVERVDIRVTGPLTARKQARNALGERGLWLTPTDQYDDWSRGDFAGPISPRPHVSGLM